MAKDYESSINHECANCGKKYDVPFVAEADEHNWGADADGNRGIFVPGALIIGDTDAQCPACSTDNTAMVRVRIEDMLLEMNYPPEPEDN